MKTQWQRFASYGLYLALVAALASAGLYIVQRQFNLPLQIGLGLILIGLAVFAILDPDHVRRIFTGRQARYGSNVLVMSIAFIGILGVVNYLGNQYSQRWDLTADKAHTLAPETIKILQSLSTTSPVNVDAFFTSAIPNDTAKSTLEDFKYHAKAGTFTYQFINPTQNPVLAQQEKITQDGSIVLHMNGHQEIVTTTAEQDLTSALVRLINPGQRNVYFLTGHGEQDPDASGTRAYGLAKAALTAKNYTVKKLNLLTEHQVPSDASVLVIAGPTKPVSADEIKPIQDYLAKGGALVVLEEPLPVTDFGTSPDPLADYLAQKWDIVLGNDIIVDQASNNLSVAVEQSYGNSPITQKLTSQVTIFPTARSVLVQGTPPANITATPLVSTGNQSWAETDFAALASNSVAFDAAKDKPGPINLAATLEDTTTKSHLVVIGDSDFASDTVFNQYGNADFFVNVMDWASGQQNLISLTPKQTTTRILLNPQAYFINLVFLGTVIVIPGLVLFSGILTWIQRRRRG